MENDPGAIELAEAEVTRLIDICHQNLDYWHILKIFLCTSERLMMLADAEFWQKQEH